MSPRSRKDFEIKPEPIDAAARDQQFSCVGSRTLLPLEAVGEQFERGGKTLRRCVLERRDVSRVHELRQDAAESTARKGQRIREAPRERDDSRHRGERENLDQTFRNIRSRTSREELRRVQLTNVHERRV